MKRNIIFSAAITVLGLAIISNGQTTGRFKLTFSSQTSPAGVETTIIKFKGLPSNIRLLEAVVSATSEGECFATTDLSNARPIGPDRAALSYDYSTGVYKLIWVNQSENSESCRILVGSGPVDAHDFIVWRRAESHNTPLTEENLIDKAPPTDGISTASKVAYVYEGKAFP